MADPFWNPQQLKLELVFLTFLLLYMKVDKIQMGLKHLYVCSPLPA